MFIENEGKGPFLKAFKENLGLDKNVLKGFDKPSFYETLRMIDENRIKWQNQRDECRKKGEDFDFNDALQLMKWDIINEEESQTESRFKRWNVTVYAPKDANGDFAYQFCSAPPDCTRIFFSFDQLGQPQLSISPSCIVAEPSTADVYAYYGGGSDRAIKSENTLEDTIKQLDEQHIQRIAIVGFARNFPDYVHDQQKELIGPELLKTKMMYQQRAFYASIAMDSFIHGLQKHGVAFTTVNGGWAGQSQAPREVGVTFMGHLHGLAHELEDARKTQKIEGSSSILGGFYPPITVMPQGGSSDAVTMAARIPGLMATPVTESKSMLSAETIASRTQFIVEGEWGSDSPYLAAIATAMIVIEPAGRWTQIEMQNAMEQGRPVVILASPENYDKNWLIDHKPDPQYAGLVEGKKFVEISFPTKADPDSTVRAYLDPTDAADWIAWRYEVDQLPKNISSFLKSTLGQTALAVVLKELSLLDKDQIIDLNKARKIEQLLIGTIAYTPGGLELDVIAKSIAGKDTQYAIKTLQLFQSPDSLENVSQIPRPKSEFPGYSTAPYSTLFTTHKKPLSATQEVKKPEEDIKHRQVLK